MIDPQKPAIRRISVGIGPSANRRCIASHSSGAKGCAPGTWCERRSCSCHVLQRPIRPSHRGSIWCSRDQQEQPQLRVEPMAVIRGATAVESAGHRCASTPPSFLIDSLVRSQSSCKDFCRGFEQNAAGICAILAPLTGSVSPLKRSASTSRACIWPHRAMDDRTRQKHAPFRIRFGGVPVHRPPREGGVRAVHGIL
jgi:hypothetical protein